MDEEKDKKNDESQGAGKDNTKGDQPKELDAVERAELVAERLEKATEANKATIREKKEVIAKAIIGGQTTASQVPEKKAEVSNVQYYKDVISGKYNIKRE